MVFSSLSVRSSKKKKTLLWGVGVVKWYKQVIPVTVDTRVVQKYAGVLLKIVAKYARTQYQFTTVENCPPPLSTAVSCAIPALWRTL